VGVGHAGRIGRFGRQRHVDGDDEQPARRQRAIHGFLGEAVLPVPRPAVQIENGREGAGAFGLVDPGHQHPAGGVAPKLDVADGEVEAGARIIGGRAGRFSALPDGAGGGQAERARGGHPLENVTARWCPLGHSRLLSTLRTN
jgi:hypothetical protein